MNTLKLTKEDAGEARHKLRILADEPDLQADHELTQDQAKALYGGIPLEGGDWRVPDWAVKAVAGEFEDHANVLRRIAADARRGGENGQSLRIHKQAKRFEGFAEQLRP